MSNKPKVVYSDYMTKMFNERENENIFAREDVFGIDANELLETFKRKLCDVSGKSPAEVEREFAEPATMGDVYMQCEIEHRATKALLIKTAEQMKRLKSRIDELEARLGVRG
jgi:BMFP domain-containing protein YqiC